MYTLARERACACARKINVNSLRCHSASCLLVTAAAAAAAATIVVGSLPRPQHQRHVVVVTASTELICIRRRASQRARPREASQRYESGTYDQIDFSPDFLNFFARVFSPRSGPSTGFVRDVVMKTRFPTCARAGPRDLRKHTKFVAFLRAHFVSRQRNICTMTFTGIKKRS